MLLPPAGLPRHPAHPSPRRTALPRAGGWRNSGFSSILCRWGPTGVHFARQECILPAAVVNFAPHAGPPRSGWLDDGECSKRAEFATMPQKNRDPSKNPVSHRFDGSKGRYLQSLSSSPLERPAPRTTNSWPRNGCKLLAALPGLRGQRLCRGGRERGGAAAAAAARAHGPAPAAWPCARSTGAR
jgi:hypothetical protein